MNNLFVIINSVIGTLLFVLLVIWILMIRATNRDIKKIEESIKVAEVEEKEAERRKK